MAFPGGYQCALLAMGKRDPKDTRNPKDKWGEQTSPRVLWFWIAQVSPPLGKH